MIQNKQDKLPKQKKVQDLYRKSKQQHKEDKDEDVPKMVTIIVDICVLLGILVLLLNALLKISRLESTKTAECIFVSNESS